jgi:hypothetical protein
MEWLQRFPWVGRSPQVVTTQALTTQLVRCHRWLHETILQGFGPAFAPVQLDLPVELATTSPRALAWTLVAFALETTDRRAVLSAWPLLSADEFNAGALIGDFAALHLHIERLVASACRDPLMAAAVRDRRRPSRDGKVVLSSRAPGGLRRQAFLETYPSLGFDPLVRGEALWQQAIDRLIAASPLTQLIYLDAVHLPVAPASWRTLLAPAPGEQAWHVQWVSQLARSLLGAFLSPAPSAEPLHVADRTLRDLAHVETFPERATSEELAAYGAAQAARDAYGAGCRIELTQRLQLLNSLWQLSRPPEGVEPIPAVADRAPAVHLHLRFQDMLVRDIVARSLREVWDEWQTEKRGVALPRPRDRITAEEGACFNRYVRTMTGSPWRQGVTSRSAGAVPPAAQGLLQCTLPPELVTDELSEEAEALASGAGLPRGEAERLLQRFGNATMAPVNVPFQSADAGGDAPRDILALWALHLLNSLSSPGVQVTNILEPVPAE